MVKANMMKTNIKKEKLIPDTTYEEPDLKNI